MKRILITGGAGFVGTNLALGFRKKYSQAEIIALDNLKRRGSELNLARLRDNGITFVHGDVRIKEDLFKVGEVNLIVDCSAEPSVLAGQNGSPEYVIHTNLTGTINTLELARIHGSTLVFLSSSRVYPVEPINKLAYGENETRFNFSGQQAVPGASEFGISERFPLDGARSLYGASKLASELFVQEYIDAYGIKAIINRCGVLTGPWQMGNVEQGVVVLWVAKHFFNKELSYIGYGGTGKQFRDILHIDDLTSLVLSQLADLDTYIGKIFNVGGGLEVSVSLRELTQLCRQSTGNTIPIAPVFEERPNDLRGYIADCRKIQDLSSWKPIQPPEAIIEDLTRWISDNRVALEPILS